MIFKGIITAKVTQTSKKTGNDYTTFSLGEKKFNCFDADTIKAFHEGDNVEILTKTNGKYENMVSMKKIDAEAPKPQINAVPNSPQFSSQSSIISGEIVTQLKRIADSLEKMGVKKDA